MPHSAVLKRSCLLVSHAGHGIVAKSLYYGVPMVLVPWPGISLAWLPVLPPLGWRK